MSLAEDLVRRITELEQTLERLATLEPAGAQRLVGEIIEWGGTSLPPTKYGRWYWCNGGVLSRTDEAELFEVLGVTHGAGDGSTTFNVPDRRGRVGLGKDNMGGSSANRVTASQADNLGQGSGAENHTLTESEIPSHYHSFNINGGAGSQGAIQVVGSGVLATPTNTTSTGGGAAHNNMPPYLTMNYIIYAGG